MIPDDVKNLDFDSLLNSIIDFLDTFFNDVMDLDMVGLIMYLWGCIPSFIRLFMMFFLILACILSLVSILKGSGEF